MSIVSQASLLVWAFTYLLTYLLTDQMSQRQKP